jgi:hypothetical protein
MVPWLAIQFPGQAWSPIARRVTDAPELKRQLAFREASEAALAPAVAAVREQLPLQVADLVASGTWQAVEPISP